MHKFLLITMLVTILGTLSGCGAGAGTQNIDVTNDPGKAVMELDYRDFEQAASEMMQSLIQSGALTKEGGGRYVVATGKIVNDTMQRIDTDQLMAKVEQELLNSGKAVVTSAIGGKGATDDMIYQVRDIKEGERADEFAADSQPAKGQIIAPELSLSGKIFQRNIRYDRGTQQVEYYFQLRLTEVSSGLRFWQNEVMLGKRGDKRAVPW